MQAWIDVHPVLFSLVFVICIWSGVNLLLSWLSGWALLARKYRLRTKFNGPRWWLQSGRLGIIPSHGAWIVGANSDGLYMAMFPLFRPGHPPLLIPWSDTSVPRNRSFYLPSMDFQIGTKPSVVLSVPAALAEKIVDAARSSEQRQAFG
jgi:hypothetical protein